MPLNVGDISPISVPPAIGGAVLDAEPLRHGQANAATGGIWRVRGPDGTAILKVARHPAGTDPAKGFPDQRPGAHWNYWRRETFAYETGLAGTAYADAGITAPALLETSTRPGGDVELWLADVPGTGGFDWPVPRLARFARELGATQARCARPRPPDRMAVPPLARPVPGPGAQLAGPGRARRLGPPEPRALARAGPDPAPRAVGRPGPGAGRRRRPPRIPCVIWTSGPPT